MKSFEYTAVDAAGHTIVGTVNAADLLAAQELLAARDCYSAEITASVETSENLPRLSESDGVELASYISQLAVVGLPMNGALTAMANDLPPGRLPEVLRAIADKVESGQSLESALESLSSRMPAHIRNLMIASVRSRQFPQVLGEVLAHERIMDDLTGKFRQAIAYPIVLASFLLVWLLFASLWLVPQMQLESIVEDFGLSWSGKKNPSSFVSSTRALREFSQVAPTAIGLLIGGSVLLVGVACMIGGKALASRLFAQVPLLGLAWWYRGLVEFSGLLALFVRQQLPLAESLRLVALSTRDPAVRAACSRCAELVANGRSLSASLASTSFFPATLVNLVEWGESHAALAEALESARQMFSDRFELQIQLVRFILPPIVFLMVAGSTLLIAYGYLAYVPKLLNDLFYW